MTKLACLVCRDEINVNNVNILLDLSFVSNVRYLDEQEMYLSDQLELYKTLPFARCDQNVCLVNIETSILQRRGNGQGYPGLPHVRHLL